MLIKASEVEKEMKKLVNKEKAKLLAGFFKTGSGQYGEGDLFLGITVPVSRKIAVRYSELSFSELDKLIKNKYHEIRLVAILILVHKYRKSKNVADKKNIVNFYLAHTKYINNWDLVDLSAHYILGNYLINKNNITILKKLAKSKNIWERRIAIISTFAFIYKGEHKYTFEIAKILMKDGHDLIHKASGWMLREVGKRINEKELCIFLDTHVKSMPRTMLRYAIERLPNKKRLSYLNIK